MDDQRIEAMHPFIRPIWNRYKRLGGEKQLLFAGRCLNNRTLLRMEKKTMTKKSVEDQ